MLLGNQELTEIKVSTIRKIHLCRGGELQDGLTQLANGGASAHIGGDGVGAGGNHMVLSIVNGNGDRLLRTMWLPPAPTPSPPMWAEAPRWASWVRRS